MARFRMTAAFRLTMDRSPLDLDLTGSALAELGTARVRVIELAGHATTVPEAPGATPAQGTAKITIRSDYD
jgi:hypothetical protein